MCFRSNSPHVHFYTFETWGELNWPKLHIWKHYYSYKIKETDLYNNYNYYHTLIVFRLKKNAVHRSQRCFSSAPIHCTQFKLCLRLGKSTQKIFCMRKRFLFAFHSIHSNSLHTLAHLGCYYCFIHLLFFIYCFLFLNHTLKPLHYINDHVCGKDLTAYLGIHLGAVTLYYFSICSS